jgi:GNAT superfamily N-acetyltransferase
MTDSASIATRRATGEDIDIMLADVQAGFDSYVQFAGPGWHPPNAFEDRVGSAELLARPDTFALIALVDGGPVGHIAFTPGRDRLRRSLIPGLAHLWQLFVLPPWWGRGVAPLLHREATEEMVRQGYRLARLYTPVRHSRARRFYEQRGWELVGEEWNTGLALMLAEYHLTLRT